MTAGRRALVALILTATALFVVGVVLERHATHNEATETPAQRAAETPAQRAAGSTTSRTTVQHTASRESGEGESAGDNESGEGGEGGGERAKHKTSGESGTSSGSDENTSLKANTETHGKSSTAGAPTTEPAAQTKESEKLLGVDPESTGMLVVAVVASLLLAAGVWWLGASVLLLGVVAVAMALFGALDVREIVHQADESHTGVMLLAALVAALHVAAALLAGRGAVAARDSGPPGAAHATG